MANPIQILSLYSGSGMLDEAVAAGLDYHGFGSRVLGFVEREAFAASFLLARMEAAALERAPVWCDGLESLDARPLRGYVDLLTASPPCQPYSSAGKRLGNADQRSHGDGDGPLVHTVRIVAECRPALVYFENVPEWVTGGHFREFGEQLCRVGYDFAPPLFVAAADVGAPHERERVFILGWLADADEARWRRHEPGRGADRGATAAGAGEELGDAEYQGAIIADAGGRERGSRRGRQRSGATGEALAQRAGGGFGVGREPSGGDGLAEGCNENVALAGGEGFQGHEFGAASHVARTAARGSTAECRCDVPLFPPGRNDYRRWAALAAGGLDAALMPAIESGVPTLADGLPVAHADLLRLGGNAVVPQAAAVAFATLFGEWLSAANTASE